MFVDKSLAGALEVAVRCLKDPGAVDLTDLDRVELDEIIEVLTIEKNKPTSNVLINLDKVKYEIKESAV